MAMHSGEIAIPEEVVRTLVDAQSRSGGSCRCGGSRRQGR
jgi:hypothetical protein